MGSWLYLAFVQTEDRRRVEAELARLLVAEGRRLMDATEATELRPAKGMEPWVVAGFEGTPGWTVLATTPGELLVQRERPLLAELARRLGTSAFQYNVYDGDSHFLLESDHQGRIERSGFVGSDPTRLWGGEPPEERIGVRFWLIDPSDAATWAEREMPERRVTGLVPSFRPPNKEFSAERRAALEPMWWAMEERFSRQREALLAWLGRVGGELREGPRHTWRAHPAQVVRALRSDGDSFLSIEGVVDSAIKTVFGGPNRDACDTALVPPLHPPPGGFLLVAVPSLGSSAHLRLQE